jgi:hypothetical protein
MVTSKAQPITEPYSLTQIDTSLIPSGNRTDGTASTWIKIWKFHVPDGIAMILGPEDIIALYLEDASAEVQQESHQVFHGIIGYSRSDGWRHHRWETVHHKGGRLINGLPDVLFRR